MLTHFYCARKPTEPPEAETDYVTNSPVESVVAGALTGEGENARLLIAGVPKAGKTTLAEFLEQPTHLATDDLVGEYDWSDLSLEVSERMDAPGPWSIEGVRAVHALRKWMKNHPGETPPVEVVVFLGEPRVELEKKGQRSMARACWTIWRQIRTEVMEGGVVVIQTSSSPGVFGVGWE